LALFFNKILFVVLMPTLLLGCTANIGGTLLQNQDDQTVVLNFHIQYADDVKKELTLTLKNLTTLESQQKGLMFIEALPTNTGVILSYQSEHERSIWMRNMLIPIDAIFLNKHHQITAIYEQLPPCLTNKDCPIYSSKQTQFIIELPAGLIEKHRINRLNTTLVSWTQNH
jgi:uncharacterized membrane protein (UPF0127 family)